MSFLLPLGLLGLLVVPIVALLHLIRQRRERVRVPSLQIWRQLERQSVQQQPRRLPLTLLLLLHLLLAVLLAIALGQPFWEAVRGQATHVAIVLDTSSSMAASDEAPSRFAAATAEARRVIDGLRGGDTAVLVELSTQPRILAQGSARDTSALLVALERSRAGGPDGDLQAALNLAQATGEPNQRSRTLILTDQALRGPERVAIAGDAEWRQFGSDGDNTAIVAFAARLLPNGQQQLYARVANLGDAPIARTLELRLDGTSSAREPMRLAAGGEAEWSWTLPAGTSRAEVTLTGSDLQALDDQAALVLGSTTQRRVVLVTALSSPLERAFRALRNTSVNVVAPSAYQPSTSADVFVFYNYVPAQFPAAPTLLVAPPADHELLEIAGDELAPAPAVSIDERFSAIDWKPVTFERVPRITPPPWASVAVESDDVPLVLTGQYNDQAIAVWAFDPAASNLPNRLAFPLLTAATTRTLLPQPNDRLVLGANAPFALVAPDGARIDAGSRLTTPGVYEAATGSGAIAVNALDPNEADLHARPAPVIAMTPQRAVEDASTPVGRELWRPLVIAGLLVLLAEWIYINRAGLRRGRGASRERQVLS